MEAALFGSNDRHAKKPERLFDSVPMVVNPAWGLISSWSQVLPPSRPSMVHLGFIANAIRQNCPNKGTAGILGSTPEFRDLASGLSLPVAIFERSIHAYDQLTDLRLSSGQETLIEGDWRATLQQHKNTFAVILSDLTSGNIPYADRQGFYVDIRAALVDGGLFIDRVLMHTKDSLYSTSRIQRRFARAPYNLLELNAFNCLALFRSELLYSELVDTSLAYEVLGHDFTDLRVRKFLERNQIITPSGGIWWYGRDWQHLEADYCSGLQLIGRLSEPKSSPYSNIGFLNIFVKGRS